MVKRKEPPLESLFTIHKSLNTKIINNMKAIKVSLVLTSVLVFLGANVQAQEETAGQAFTRHQVSAGLQGFGIGSMPFRGLVSWTDQPGLAFGFGANYTYWFNEHVGFRTGLRMNRLTHNQRIANFDMAFDASLPLSSVVYGSTSTALTTVSLHGTATTIYEEQKYSFIELPLMVALQYNKMFLNVGVAFTQAISAEGDFSYANPVCEITALPDLGTTSNPPTPLTLNSPSSAKVYNSDMVKPFYALLGAEAGYNFYLNPYTSIGVGLFGRLTPFARTTHNTIDVYGLTTDAKYEIFQPSTTRMAEKVGYYELGVSVNLNIGFGETVGDEDESGYVLTPFAAGNSQLANNELDAAKAAREQAEAELAAVKQARKSAEAELNAMKQARKSAEAELAAAKQAREQAEDNRAELAQLAKSANEATRKADLKPVQPAPRQEVVKHAEKILVYFDFNKTEPLYDETTGASIRALSEQMQADENLKVIVIGHTDSVGSSKNNVSLGRKRAATVRRMMVDLGAPRKNIEIGTRGEAEPAESNETQEGRAHNRRVTVEVK